MVKVQALLDRIEENLKTGERGLDTELRDPIELTPDAVADLSRIPTGSVGFLYHHEDGRIVSADNWGDPRQVKGRSLLKDISALREDPAFAGLYQPGERRAGPEISIGQCIFDVVYGVPMHLTTKNGTLTAAVPVAVFQEFFTTPGNLQMIAGRRSVRQNATIDELNLVARMDHVVSIGYRHERRAQASYIPISVRQADNLY